MLNNSLYQTIMRDFNRRQAEQKHQQDLRIQEIYKTIPEYEVLDQDIVSACAKEARMRILNPGHDFSKNQDILRDQISAIKATQKQLLLDAGFPEDYPELRYVCPICKDTGFSENVFEKQPLSLSMTSLRLLPLSKEKTLIPSI